MELGTAVNDYIRERTRNRSLGTNSVGQVTRTLWRFANYFGSDRDVRSITFDEVNEWVGSIGRAARTVRCYASQAHGLFTWLAIREVIDRDPFLGVRLPPEPESVPRALERETVEACFLACRDARETLMVSLMVQEGLRAAELAHLELGDIAHGKSALFVRQGKGRKDRNVPLTGETRRLLAAYVAEFQVLGAGPLIRSHLNASVGISPHRVSNIMSELFWRAGVKIKPRDGFSGHAFRHTAASDVLVAADYDVRVPQEFLGHKSIATTQVYLKSVAADRLRAAVDGRTYRSVS